MAGMNHVNARMDSTILELNYAHKARLGCFILLATAFPHKHFPASHEGQGSLKNSMSYIGDCNRRRKAGRQERLILKVGSNPMAMQLPTFLVLYCLWERGK